MFQCFLSILLDIQQCKAVRAEIGQRFHASTADTHILLFEFLQQHTAVALSQREVMTQPLGQGADAPNSFGHTLNITILCDDLETHESNGRERHSMLLCLFKLSIDL